jgi:hypothetical protein
MIVKTCKDIGLPICKGCSFKFVKGTCTIQYLYNTYSIPGLKPDRWMLKHLKDNHLAEDMANIHLYIREALRQSGNEKYIEELDKLIILR